MNKIGLIIVVLSVVTASYLFISSDKDEARQSVQTDLSEKEASSSVNTSTHADSGSQRKKNSEQSSKFEFDETSTDRTSQSNLIQEPEGTTDDSTCISAESFEQDPRNLVMERWMIENLMTPDYENLMAKYGYANEAELLRYAEEGDAKAMWALGINYRWYANHENFQSFFLKPTDLPVPNYQDKPLDLSILEKSRYWFEQAALHGLISGLTEMDHTFIMELESIAQDEPARQEEVLITQLVYKQLLKEVSPSFASVLENFSGESIDTSHLSPEAQSSFDSLLKSQLDNWEKARQKMGAEKEVTIDIPAEVRELSEMLVKICAD